MDIKCILLNRFLCTHRFCMCLQRSQGSELRALTNSTTCVGREWARLSGPGLHRKMHSSPARRTPYTARNLTRNTIIYLYSAHDHELRHVPWNRPAQTCSVRPLAVCITTTGRGTFSTILDHANGSGKLITVLRYGIRSKWRWLPTGMLVVASTPHLIFSANTTMQGKTKLWNLCKGLYGIVLGGFASSNAPDSALSIMH